MACWVPNGLRVQHLPQRTDRRVASVSLGGGCEPFNMPPERGPRGDEVRDQGVANEQDEEWWLDLHFENWRECSFGPCMRCEKGAP